MAAGLHPEAEVLSELITQQKKSLDEVARGAGIKPARLYRIISGKADMTVNEEDLFCNYLGISVRELLRKVLNSGKTESRQSCIKFRDNVHNAI